MTKSKVNKDGSKFVPVTKSYGFTLSTDGTKTVQKITKLKEPDENGDMFTLKFVGYYTKIEDVVSRIYRSMVDDKIRSCEIDNMSDIVRAVIEVKAEINEVCKEFDLKIVKK